LICDVRRFGNEGDFIAFKMMVLFLICLSWSVLLGHLLWWHRELFLAEPRWAPMLGVSENLDETPEHEFKESQNVQVHR
jgi:hypothetical protein